MTIVIGLLMLAGVAAFVAWPFFARRNSEVAPEAVASDAARWERQKADAYGAIYRRHEIAEVSRAMAGLLGFEYGAHGHVWFGACPPTDGPETRGQAWSDWQPPEPYAPPLVVDEPPFEPHRSFYPYPQQQPVSVC